MSEWEYDNMIVWEEEGMEVWQYDEGVMYIRMGAWWNGSMGV